MTIRYIKLILIDGSNVNNIYKRNFSNFHIQENKLFIVAIENNSMD